VTERVRPARPDDLPKLCELEQIPGAPFRELGMDFVADRRDLDSRRAGALPA
jgi:hypothetical protein